MRCTVVTGVQTCSFPICRLGSSRRTAATVPADPARTREALKDQASSSEEGKADILGLYMIRQLADMGELAKTKLMDNYKSGERRVGTECVSTCQYLWSLYT